MEEGRHLARSRRISKAVRSRSRPVLDLCTVVLYGCHCAYSYRVLREKWIPLFCMKGSDIFPPPRGI